MRITQRDVRLLRDLALSHLLARDQILELGYFGSVTRLNFRLRELRRAGLVRVLSTPFHGQMLYVVGPRALPVIGERIARLVRDRQSSPRFLRHALAATGIRTTLMKTGGKDWRFEPQLHHHFWHGRRELVLKPDGFVRLAGIPTFIEADMGHASMERLRQKLRCYDALRASGEDLKGFGFSSFEILVVTTGGLRKRSMIRQLDATVPLSIKTFEELAIDLPGEWS